MAYELKNFLKSVNTKKLSEKLRDDITDFVGETDNFKKESPALKSKEEDIISRIKDETGASSDQDPDKLIADLTKLIKNRNSNNPEMSELNVEQLRGMVKEIISERKLTFENLSQELQDFITNKRIIHVKYPELKDIEVELGEQTKTIPIIQYILDDIRWGANIYLVGAAGTGKTFLVDEVSNKILKLGKPMVINCNQYTAPLEIMGGFTIDGYHEGKLIEAWRDGKILLLDEMPKLDPNSAGLLNDALSKSKLSGDKSVIQNARGDNFEKHPNFACIATGNVYPNKTSSSYTANNRQDLSLLDRFSGSVYEVGANEALEDALILPYQLVLDLCRSMRTVINEKGYDKNAIVSLRTMINFRDSFINEIQNYYFNNDHPNEKIKGKTLRIALDSYLTAFTDEQKNVIKKQINYDQFVTEYKLQIPKFKDVVIKESV